MDSLIAYYLQVIVTAEGARHVFEKMAELPFDSFRKCMTVIVRDAEGVRLTI